MPPTWQLIYLRVDSDWVSLGREWGISETSSAAAVLEYARRLGAKWCLREDDYLDFDYRATRANEVFVNQFRGAGVTCVRYHFYDEPYPRPDWVGFPMFGENHGRYLGFTVRRPLTETPVGRTVLAAPSSDPRIWCSCASEYAAHVDGFLFRLESVAFAQQDSLVMSCAETAMWTAARVLSEHYEQPRALPNRIVEQTAHGRRGRMSTLAGGLSEDEITSALHGLGFSALLYHPRTTTYEDPMTGESVTREKEDVILDLVVPYVSSGLPVMLATRDHVVTAIGVRRGDDSQLSNAPRIIPSSRLADALVVHDDVAGPYRLMPRGVAYRDGGAGETVLPIPQNYAERNFWWREVVDVDTIFVPLPDRIVFPAEPLEALTERLLQSTNIFRANLDRVLAASKSKGSGAAEDLHDLLHHGGALLTAARLRPSVTVRQEYLREHPVVRATLRETPLPKYVWVVDIGRLKTVIEQERDSDAFPLLELVFDATSGQNRGEYALLFARAGGCVFARQEVCRGNDLAGDWTCFSGGDDDFARAHVPLWHRS